MLFHYPDSLALFGALESEVAHESGTIAVAVSGGESVFDVEH